MWLKRKWLSECRIACQPEALKGTASHYVWLQNGLYTFSFPACVRVYIEAHRSLFVRVCLKAREGVSGRV